MRKQNRVLIIGAGASGLFAAIAAAEHGASVTVLEKEKKAGRKLLRTGNGKCNMTNIGDASFSYHGTDRAFAERVLGQFSPADTIRKFTQLGIYTMNRDGWIYPHCETAESVLTVLLWRCSELKVKIKCNETVTDIKREEGTFTVYTGSWHYAADRVILSCGSMASLIKNQLPANGYDLAEMMGHRVIKPLPALVPLKVKDAGRYKWSGVRINGSVKLFSDGIYIAEDRGQIQLTENGISGIPVFTVSGRAVRLLDGGRTVTAVLDFFPDMTADLFASFLARRMEEHPNRSFEENLIGILPERLIHAVTAEYARQINQNTKHADPETMARVIKNFEVKITGSQGFAFAQCASGGVPTEEVYAENCASRIADGFYLTGEVLDIDGKCGGWNLQFAWTTGYLAGVHAAEVL